MTIEDAAIDLAKAIEKLPREAQHERLVAHYKGERAAWDVVREQVRLEKERVRGTPAVAHLDAAGRAALAKTTIVERCRADTARLLDAQRESARLFYARFSTTPHSDPREFADAAAEGAVLMTDLIRAMQREAMAVSLTTHDLATVARTGPARGPTRAPLYAASGFGTQRKMTTDMLVATMTHLGYTPTETRRVLDLAIGRKVDAAQVRRLRARVRRRPRT